MVAKATIWDAYRRVQHSGKIVQRGEKGLTIEDSSGVRHYATLDRIISREGEDEIRIEENNRNDE